jgi:hypothetical protein
MARRKTADPAVEALPERAPAAAPEPTQAAPPPRMRLSPLPPGPTTWASAIRVAPPPVALDATIDAEFSATQIRELARALGVTLRGTSKSGFIDRG